MRFRPRSLLAAVAVLVAATAGAAEAVSTETCSDALIISARTAKVVRRLQLPVYSVVADGHGGWYAADIRLRHLKRDGSIDESWHSPVSRRLPYGSPAAYGMLARFKGRLYIAGRRRVAAVAVRTGRVLWLSPAVTGPMLDGRRPAISALAAGRGVVYVGGRFTGLGAARRTNLAALDAATGHPLQWKAPAVEAPGFLALSSSRLYFADVSGVGAVRAGDGRSTSFSPHARLGDIGALAAAGRLVLVGGGEAGGVFEARDGRPVRGFAFDQVGAATAIGVSGSTAYLGGWFGGKIDLIAINLRTGRYEKWFPKTLDDYPGGAGGIAVSGDRVFVGGSFCRRA